MCYVKTVNVDIFVGDFFPDTENKNYKKRTNAHIFFVKIIDLKTCTRFWFYKKRPYKALITEIF